MPAAQRNPAVHPPPGHQHRSCCKLHFLQAPLCPSCRHNPQHLSRSQRGPLSRHDVTGSNGGSGNLQPLQPNNKQLEDSSCSIAVKALGRAISRASSHSRPCIWWANGHPSQWILQCGVLASLWASYNMRSGQRHNGYCSGNVWVCPGGCPEWASYLGCGALLMACCNHSKGFLLWRLVRSAAGSK